MKKITRRNFMKATLSVTAIGAMSACGGATSGSSTSSASSAANSDVQTAVEVDPYGPVSEAVTLTIGRTEDSSATYLSGQNSADNYVLNHISEKLGVSYDYSFSVPNDTYDTKVSMAITTGDIPDVMKVNETQFYQLAAAGALADITAAYNTYASENLKAAYDSTFDISLNSVTVDGKLLALPGINPGADSIPLLFVRADWMKELNIKAPETVDDIINIVNIFAEKKATTEGLVVSSNITSSGGNNTYGIDALFAAFGAYPKYFVKNANGDVVYGSNTPECKKALGEIRKLVESNVIAPSFVVRDSAACEEIITSGKSGIFYGVWWNMNWPLVNMLAEDINATWNCYLAPLTADGKYNTGMISPSNSYLVVSAKASEAAKEAAIKTCNYQLDIDQSQGVDLKTDETDPYSWTYMPFSALICPYNDKEQKAAMALAVLNDGADEDTMNTEAAQWYASYVQAEEDLATAYANNNTNGWGCIRAAGMLHENEAMINKVFAASYATTETMSSKWATLEKLEDELYLQILNGEAELDAFDEYVSKWDSLGGKDIIAELSALI